MMQIKVTKKMALPTDSCKPWNQGYFGFSSYNFGSYIRRKDGHDIICESHASEMYFTSIALVEKCSNSKKRAIKDHYLNLDV